MNFVENLKEEYGKSGKEISNLQKEGSQVRLL
jgi:hypothetical protein